MKAEFFVKFPASQWSFSSYANFLAQIVDSTLPCSQKTVYLQYKNDLNWLKGHAEVPEALLPCIGRLLKDKDIDEDTSQASSSCSVCLNNINYRSTDDANLNNCMCHTSEFNQTLHQEVKININGKRSATLDVDEPTTAWEEQHAANDRLNPVSPAAKLHQKIVSIAFTAIKDKRSPDSMAEIDNLMAQFEPSSLGERLDRITVSLLSTDLSNTVNLDAQIIRITNNSCDQP
jgi:hypothetical protein